MIVIRSKEAYKNCACEKTYDPEAFSVERLQELRITSSVLLPESSNHRGSSAGVTGNEIPGAQRSSNIGTLGQVNSIGFGGTQGSMPAWGGEPKTANLPKLPIESQRPLGVDSGNGTPANFNDLKGVSNSDSRFQDLELRNPKQQPAASQEQSCCGQANQKAQKTTLLPGQNQSQGQDCCQSSSQNLSKAGSKAHPETLEGVS